MTSDAGEPWPGYGDQARAASAEAAMFADVEGSFGDAEPCRVPEASELVKAIMLHVTAILAGIATGDTDHCEHIHLTAPRPMVALTWSHTALCLECAGPPPWPISPGPHVCDLCGEAIDGRPAGITVPVGVTILAARVCPRCASELRAG
jgi:hypothetical protein